MKKEVSKIKELYAEIRDKKSLHISVAEKFKIEPLSVKNNWFGPYFSVPVKRRKEVIEILEEVIQSQPVEID